MTLKLRLPFGSTAKKQPPETPRGPSYHAVSVHAGKDACAAAQAFSGKRVLSAAALLLPLADCDRATRCTCRYLHHDDRREGPRRQVEGAPPTSGAVAHAERRHSQGRRAEDLQDYKDTDTEDADGSQLVADTYYGYARKSSTD